MPTHEERKIAQAAIDMIDELNDQKDRCMRPEEVRRMVEFLNDMTINSGEQVRRNGAIMLLGDIHHAIKHDMCPDPHGVLLEVAKAFLPRTTQ